MSKAVWHFVTSSRLVLCAFLLLLLIILGALLGPSLSSWDAVEMDWDALEAPPSASHWFGTDLVGRDLFVRTMNSAMGPAMRRG